MCYNIYLYITIKVMQYHTQECIGVIRSRSESFGISFDYNDRSEGKTPLWLIYGAMGM
jgi:hypothetical protein